MINGKLSIKKTPIATALGKYKPNIWKIKLLKKSGINDAKESKRIPILEPPSISSKLPRYEKIGSSNPIRNKIFSVKKNKIKQKESEIFLKLK